MLDALALTHSAQRWPSPHGKPAFLFQGWEAAMTPMQKADRDIDGLRQSIRKVFQDLRNSTLEPGEKAVIVRGIQSLQDYLRQEQEKFERGN